MGDNRDLWKRYDYRDFGIIAEPYFDLDFDEVFYLTDTGRRWDGHKVSVRDKVRGRRGVDRRQRTDDGGQGTEDGRQRTEDKGQMSEDRGRRTEDETRGWLDE